MAERIQAHNKKCVALLDIAKSYIEMNQKNNAAVILAKLCEEVNAIGLNHDYEGNSYDENDEKARGGQW